MGPHAKHLDDPFILNHLIDQTVLNVNSARAGAAQVADKFLEGGRIPERIFGEDVEELLRLLPQTRQCLTSPVLSHIGPRVSQAPQ